MDEPPPRRRGCRQAHVKGEDGKVSKDHGEEEQGGVDTGVLFGLRVSMDCGNVCGTCPKKVIELFVGHVPDMMTSAPLNLRQHLQYEPSDPKHLKEIISAVFCVLERREDSLLQE